MENRDILENMLKSGTSAGREGVLSFSRYLVTCPLSLKTVPLYLKVIRTGHQGIADILFSMRDPESLFTTVTMSPDLLRGLFDLLSEINMHTVEGETAVSLLSGVYAGIEVFSLWKPPFRLTVFDIYNAGKYLVSNEIRAVELSLKIIESVSDLHESAFKDVSRTALDIMSAYYDDSKKLQQVIPAQMFK